MLIYSVYESIFEFIQVLLGIKNRLLYAPKIGVKWLDLIVKKFLQQRKLFYICVFK